MEICLLSKFALNSKLLYFLEAGISSVSCVLLFLDLQMNFYFFLVSSKCILQISLRSSKLH